MANALDLEEQEQLDELKAFWKRWGDIITWSLTLVFAGVAAYNGWNYWQRNQAQKATGMVAELERAVQAQDAAKAAQINADLRERYGRTVQAVQAGLVTAKLQADKGQIDPAIANLAWVAERGDENHAALARLRWAALALDKKDFSAASKALDGIKLPAYDALVKDRRGDIAMAQNQREAAAKAWREAWDALPPENGYRRVVEAKLASIGAAPPDTLPAVPAA